MNMSDDLVGATLQVSTEGARIAGQVAVTSTEVIAKLLSMLIKKAQEEKLLNMKSGEVSIKKMIQNVRKNGDTLSSSEQGLTAQDKEYITKKAKEYGIPVAFTSTEGKDNIYVHVRTNDLPIFQRICNDMMKEKLANRPQELGNFKVQEWEVPFLGAEFKKYDLPASFGQTKNGENFCLFEKADQKAILLARNQFVSKCKNVEENFSCSLDEDGFFVIKDKNHENQISFDSVPNKTELSRQLQESFGYDENTANIACAKFGEELLVGKEKAKFFSENPQNEFSKITSNIKVEGESIYAEQYTCLRVTPKIDEVPKIVFADKDNNFAVLSPEKMTRKEMETVLQASLQITDQKEISALIDKAENVNGYYAHFSDFSIDKNLSPGAESHWLDDTKEYAYSDPEIGIDIDIMRTDKNNFSIESSYHCYSETGKVENKESTVIKQFSFSDKKQVINDLTELYKSQGVSTKNAKSLAKETFEKAKAQSAERIPHIESIERDDKYYSAMVSVGANVANVGNGNRIEIVKLSDAEQAQKQISNAFGVSKETASTVVNKADDIIKNNSKLPHIIGLEGNNVSTNVPTMPNVPQTITMTTMPLKTTTTKNRTGEATEREKEVLNSFGFKTDGWDLDDAHKVVEMLENNNWRVPNGIQPSKYNPKVDGIPNVPKMPNVPTMGGR